MTEVRQLELEALADQYLAELSAEVGEPSEEDLAQAQALEGSAPSRFCVLGSAHAD